MNKKKSSGSRSRKQRLTAVGTRCADHVTPLYLRKFALTSPTGGGRCVGIVRSRTKATEFSFTLVYAGTMNPHHLNITKVQPLAVDIGMVPRTAGQEPEMHNPSLSPPTPNQYGQYSQRKTGTSSSTDRYFAVHTPSPSLSVTSNHTDYSIDFTCV